MAESTVPGTAAAVALPSWLFAAAAATGGGAASTAAASIPTASIPTAAALLPSMLDFNEQQPTQPQCEQLLNRTWPMRDPTDFGPPCIFSIRCVFAACTAEKRNRLWELNDPPTKERERFKTADAMRKHCERHHQLQPQLSPGALDFNEQDTPPTLQLTAPNSGLAALQRASSAAESAERRFPFLPLWLLTKDQQETIVFHDCGHPNAEEWLLYINHRWPLGNSPPTTSPVRYLVECDLDGCRADVCNLFGYREAAALRTWRLQDPMSHGHRMWLAEVLVQHCAQYHPATQLEDLPTPRRR